MNKEILLGIQIVVSVILIFLVMLQSKGSGLSRSVGFINTNSFARRGLEKTIFRLSFILTAVFIISSILQVL
jgi:protein translocase SecG subunit